MIRPEHRALPDHELIVLVAQGDGRAFEEVYNRHSGQALRLALRITGRPSTAEEVTQDAFINLWRAASRFSGARGTLSSWLLSMVHHRGVDLLRRTARHDGELPIGECIVAGLQAPEHIEELYADLERRQETRALVSDLPADQRRAIELGYFSGLTQSQIAVRTGSPLGTVKGRQRLALQKLRFALTQQPAAPR